MSGAPFVVVIGPPGVGKSTVAAQLAERLGRRYVDSDALVEEREGRSISDLFVDEGEDYFRAAEQRTVLDALTEDGTVLDEVLVEAPLGHRLRREEAKPEILKKYKNHIGKFLLQYLA